MAAGYRFPDAMLIIKRISTLLYVGNLDRFSQADSATIGLLGAGNHTE